MTTIPARKSAELSRHVIGMDATVFDALEAINRLSGESMTLFVTDADGRLAGTLTDGDIRRGLIAGKSLSDRVEQIAHRSFMAIKPGDVPFSVINAARKRDIDMLPMLDDDGRLKDICDLRRVKNLLPIDAVLMAGGRGERLRPLTLTTPKPLLEVGGKAIIDYNVDELIALGVENISVTVNYLREQIEAHFAEPRNGVQVRCIAEPKRLGTIGSLALVPELKNDNVLVMNSDLLTSLDFAAMLQHHLDTGAAATMAVIPYTVSVPYAIVETEDDRVKSLSEKPSYNYFANAGVYIIRRDLVKRIAADTFLDAPDFIEGLIAEGLKVSHFPIRGTWIDIGSPDDYRNARQLMSRPLK